MSKDDPLNQTLFLDGDSMVTARDNWWRAYQEGRGRTALHDEDDRHAWDISWAAAIAAISFVLEGRTGPRR